MTTEELKKEYIKKKANNVDYMSFEEYKRLHSHYDPFGNEMFIQDEVEKDNHYKKKVEPIDLIEAFDLNFNLDNVIKYVSRCNHKGNRKDDLRKALYYLKREYNDVE